MYLLTQLEKLVCSLVARYVKLNEKGPKTTFFMIMNKILEVLSLKNQFKN